MLANAAAVLGIPHIEIVEDSHDHPMLLEIVVWVCLGWSVVVVTVSLLGYVQLHRHYSSNPPESVSASLSAPKVPHVTIVRPVKGLEPHLYDCLAATFRQRYPREKLTIFFCISSRTDPAIQILERLLADFPDFDAQILVEEEDPKVLDDSNNGSKLGPNPKIRNMSRAYREAKSDIVWIIDCNVWVGKGVCGRMVDKLCGMEKTGQGLKYKFVHHLPIVVDVEGTSFREETMKLLNQDEPNNVPITSSSLPPLTSPRIANQSPLSSIFSTGGGRLEELFLATAHAKYYTAFQAVAIAPCIVGKSNMFRRSHLNHLTFSSPDRSPGIDLFSDNICEDHLIGDLLWRKQIPDERAGERWGKHALVYGDLAIQPMAGMSVQSYVARRVRWLRVRKFTVMLPTFLEPGTEYFLCSAYGAFILTTLPGFHEHLGIPQTWLAFGLLWLLSVCISATADWNLYLKLHSAASVEVDEHTPAFARPPKGLSRRPFGQWLLTWIGRESLALPIWIWAFYGGVTVVWRDRMFWVGMDMKVHEIEDTEATANGPRGRDRGFSGVANGFARQDRSKSRRD